MAVAKEADDETKGHSVEEIVGPFERRAHDADWERAG
jgi:hypothetical protein